MAVISPRPPRPYPDPNFWRPLDPKYAPAPDGGPYPKEKKQ